MSDSQPRTRVGLVLPGGGARAAYQVGVLKAIADLLPPGAANPFPIISGTSAGAINAAVLAAHATGFQDGVRRLAQVWEGFRVDQIFRVDPASILFRAVHWLTALISGGLGRYNPESLLDNSPLRRLLGEVVPCERIQLAIDSGALHALCVTASGYASGQSVTFFQGAASINAWTRSNRVGCATTITVDHLLASSALPMIFPPVRVNREYFGDGSMRQSAPLSPPLHVGADRLLVIGVRRADSLQPRREELTPVFPAFGQIAGFILDTLFLDSVDADLERLRRINRTLELISDEQLEEGGVKLRPVDVLMISPSSDIGAIAERHQQHFPRTVRFLLRGVGALNRGGRGLTSYLLFERPYCQELIALGYSDTIAHKDKVVDFLSA